MNKNNPVTCFYTVNASSSSCDAPLLIYGITARTPPVHGRKIKRSKQFDIRFRCSSPGPESVPSVGIRQNRVMFITRRMCIWCQPGQILFSTFEIDRAFCYGFFV